MHAFAVLALVSVALAAPSGKSSRSSTLPVGFDSCFPNCIASTAPTSAGTGATLTLNAGAHITTSIGELADLTKAVNSGSLPDASAAQTALENIKAQLNSDAKDASAALQAQIKAAIAKIDSAVQGFVAGGKSAQDAIAKIPAQIAAQEAQLAAQGKAVSASAMQSYASAMAQLAALRNTISSNLLSTVGDGRAQANSAIAQIDDAAKSFQAQAQQVSSQLQSAIKAGAADTMASVLSAAALFRSLLVQSASASGAFGTAAASALKDYDAAMTSIISSFVAALATMSKTATQVQAQAFLAQLQSTKTYFGSLPPTTNPANAAMLAAIQQAAMAIVSRFPGLRFSIP